MKLSLVKLSSCSGCQVALLDALGDSILELSDKLDYATILKDKAEIEPCDIVLVEGAVRTDDEVKTLEKARNNSSILVAFGTCSAFGGIPSLANLYPGTKILKEVFGKNLKNVPKFFDLAQPIDKFVDVDYYLPGCPPPLNLIKNLLTSLVEGTEPKRVDHPVCAECNRVVEFRKISGIKLSGTPEKGVCLLSQGYLCLGSVTRGGCGAVCPKSGVPCIGCRGPTPKVMVLPCLDYLSVILKRLENITGIKVKLEDPSSVYAFVFGSEMMYKPSSEIKKLMRVGWVSECQK